MQRFSALIVTGAAAMGASYAATADVLAYDADGGTGAGTPGTLTDGTVIIDQSSAGNNGSVIGTIATVEDDPFGVAGELSYSFPSDINNRINTDAVDLLNLANVSAAGGYTMDVWFKTQQTVGVGQFFAYAGTDGFRTFDGDIHFFAFTDTDGVTPSTIFSIEALAGGDLQDGNWHNVVIEFDTEGNGVVGGQVQGQYYATIDGGTRTLVAAGAFDNFGETLDRSISVGGRSAGGDQFEGQVYNPTLTLGVVPEPGSLALLGLGGLLMARRRRD